MAEKPKGKWAESASGYRPGSARAGKATRPWHVDAPAEGGRPEAEGEERAAPLAWARTLPVAALEPDPDQPRRSFEAAGLEELAASVREHGILQPLIVRRKGEGAGYVVVAGERRLRAARIAGLAEVPCMVLAGDSLRAARLAQLAENLQREDLAPMEEALAVARLAELEALSGEELARRLGKSPAYVSRIFAVSRIPSAEYGEISTSKPTMSVLYEYAQLPAEARAAAADLIRSGATVRDLEALRGRGRARGAKAKGVARRGRPMKGAELLEALRRAVRALSKIDASAARRLGADDRRAILAEQLELARWATAVVEDDRDLADAVQRLEAALTRASGERPSTREGRAGRGGRTAPSSRPR